MWNRYIDMRKALLRQFLATKQWTHGRRDIEFHRHFARTQGTPLHSWAFQQFLPALASSPDRSRWSADRRGQEWAYDIMTRPKSPEICPEMSETNENNPAWDLRDVVTGAVGAVATMPPTPRLPRFFRASWKPRGSWRSDKHESNMSKASVVPHLHLNTQVISSIGGDTHRLTHTHKIQVGVDLLQAHLCQGSNVLPPASPSQNIKNKQHMQDIQIREFNLEEIKNITSRKNLSSIDVFMQNIYTHEFFLPKRL